ncbi:MAG: efflux RND transporter periplasmic adaptor subunit [Rhodobacteraceae bacterium]|nr:efflux RND transporter periplasmic adaptor subunit [Paracoccaceae bacterium]
MRIIHVLTALLVAMFIYAMIMERDRLLAFAGAEPKTEQADETALDGVVENPAVSVVAMHSIAQQVRSGIVLRGQTEAARRVDVRSETSGRMVSEPLRRGALVETGQILCELDAGTLEAQLAEAKARQAEAEANFNVATQLAERGFGAENSAISAAAGLEAAHARVLGVERVMTQLVITAPFAGILESDTTEIGSLLQPGGLCATVIALDTIKLVGYVPELDVVRLEVGQTAGARLISGRQVVGQVSFISRSADPLTRTFRLEVNIDNADLSIRDGQTAEILIETAGETAHLLPQHVLTLNNEGDLGVRTAVNGVAKFVSVRIVRDVPEGFWLSGLPNEVDVIVVGQEYVTDGRAIDVTLQEAE